MKDLNVPLSATTRVNEPRVVILPEAEQVIRMATSAIAACRMSPATAVCKLIEGLEWRQEERTQEHTQVQQRHAGNQTNEPTQQPE
jgi:hypothetical protein